MKALNISNWNYAEGERLDWDNFGDEPNVLDIYAGEGILHLPYPQSPDNSPTWDGSPWVIHNGDATYVKPDKSVTVTVGIRYQPITTEDPERVYPDGGMKFAFYDFTTKTNHWFTSNWVSCTADDDGLFPLFQYFLTPFNLVKGHTYAWKVYFQDGSVNYNRGFNDSDDDSLNEDGGLSVYAQGTISLLVDSAGIVGGITHLE